MLRRSRIQRWVRQAMPAGMLPQPLGRELDQNDIYSENGDGDKGVGNRPRAALAGTIDTESKENKLIQANNPSPRLIWASMRWWEPQAPPMITKLIK